MVKINPLIKSSMVYIIATFVGQGMMLLGVIVFTRLMSQSDYGIYSTYYANVSIITVLIGANLHYALNNAYIDYKNDIEQFKKSILGLSTVVMCIVTLVFGMIQMALKSNQTIIEFLMLIIHSYSFFVINYRIYSANMENDYRTKQLLLIIPNMLQFIIPLLFMYLNNSFSFFSRMVGSAVSLFFLGIIIYAKILKCSGKLFDTRYWKYALRISLPSILMSLSYMLMQQSDKIMITRMCGEENTAIYSVIYYIGYAMIAVDQAVSPVRQAWLYRKIDGDNTSNVVAVQKWYLILMCIICAGLLMIGPEVVKIIAPEEYWQFDYIAAFVLSACMMMLYKFYTDIMLFYKKNIVLSICVASSAVINIGLNALLIPKLGSVVAAYTTIVAYLVLFIITMSYVECVEKKKIYNGRLFVRFIATCIAFSIFYYSTIEITILRYAVGLLELMLFFVYILKNRDELLSLVKNY